MLRYCSTDPLTGAALHGAGAAAAPGGRRVEERDQLAGIQVTEEQLREKVDLSQLDLQDDDSSTE